MLFFLHLRDVWRRPSWPAEPRTTLRAPPWRDLARTTFVGLSPDLLGYTGLTGDPYRSDRYSVEALQGVPPRACWPEKVPTRVLTSTQNVSRKNTHWVNSSAKESKIFWFVTSQISSKYWCLHLISFLTRLVDNALTEQLLRHTTCCMKLVPQQAETKTSRHADSTFLNGYHSHCPFA
jgi:hypothetical protein